MFGRFKQQKSAIARVDQDTIITQPDPNAAPFIDAAPGLRVDASCNQTITINCLRQLYNAVGVVPSATNNNSIGITGYLVWILLNSFYDSADLVQGQYANIADMQLFFANQTPAALGSNFTFISVNGNFTKKNLGYHISDDFILKADSITKPQQRLVMKLILMWSLHLVSLIQFQ